MKIKRFKNVMIVLSVIMALSALSVNQTAADWTIVNYNPGGTFRDAIYAGGQFVLIGDAGLIWTSPDGLTWTSRTSGSTINFYKGAYGNGVYVAVGYHGQIYTSSNGISWTQRHAADGDSLTSVVYNGTNLFVAGGVSGRFLTSTNGTTWTERTRWTGNYIDTLCYGNGLYIAGLSSGYVYRSSNGLDWTQCNVNTGVNNKGSIYAKGMYIVGGGASGYSSAYFSKDGITWTRCWHSPTGYFMDFAYDGINIIAGGDGNLPYGCSMLMTSTDGITWDRDYTPDYSTLMGCESNLTRSIASGTRRLIITNTPAGTGDGGGCSGDALQINVTSPNGGETLVTGNIHQVTWSSPGYTGAIKFSLWKNNTYIGAIAENYTGGSPYPWVIANYTGGTVAPGTGYKIMVEEDDGSRIADLGDATFTILRRPEIHVTSPIGGENIKIGTVHNITWTTLDITGTLKITLLKNNIQVGVIASSVNYAAGTYAWTVPYYMGSTMLPGSGYRVEIEENGTGYSGKSASDFTIYGDPFIMLMSPNGGENISLGTVHIVTWYANKVDKIFKITLWKDGAQVGILAIKIDPSRYFFVWPVGRLAGGATVPAGSGYKVKIEVVKAGLSDSSDASFTLVGSPIINVTTPTLGETLYLGASYPINWNTVNVNGTLKLSLWKDAVQVGVIADGINPALGTYTWTVGNYVGGTITSGSGFRVKIEENGTTVYGGSNGPFAISNLPSITINTPNGGETLVIGNTTSITWNTNDIKRSLKITLWKDSVYVGAIAENIDSSRNTYPWVVGNYKGGIATAGAGYKVKIEEEGGSFSDLSNTNFTLSD